MAESLIKALVYIAGYRVGGLTLLLERGVNKDTRFQTALELSASRQVIDHILSTLFSPEYKFQSLTIDSEGGKLTMKIMATMPNGEEFEVFDFLKKNLEFYTYGLSEGQRKEILNDLSKEYLIQNN